MNRAEARKLIQEYCKVTGQNWLIIEAITLGVVEFQSELTERQIAAVNKLGHQEAIKISGYNTESLKLLERGIKSINEFGKAIGIKPLDGSDS